MFFRRVSVGVKSAGLLVLTACTLLAASRPERYVLLLEDKPLAESASSAKEAFRSARSQTLAAKQQTLAEAVAEHHYRVTGRQQLLVNALFVEAPPGAEDELLSLPGVRAVERLRPMKRHLDAALNLMNVPAAWSAVNGPQNAGAGVKIAVLDTGIDQNHPAFQDASLSTPAGFPKCAGSDCAWTNSKIIAARSYVQMLAGTDPVTSRPDDLTPRDRAGHGTAVAMIAAGVRNSGPVATITGVAPRAWLGNYKIFGSPGVNGRFTFADVIVQALTDVVSDGMDVAVLSLGAPAEWGPRDNGATCKEPGSSPCDWRAQAVENASRMGLTVVISAGNSGDSGSVYPAFTSVETPGTAPSAITVGATTNSHVYYQSVRIDGPNVPADLRRINAYFSNGPKPAPGLSGPIRDVASLGDNGKACSPLGNGVLNGAIALILRGDCQFTTKVVNAQKAGAIGVVVYQAGQNDQIFQVLNQEETGIPSALIRNRDGVALKNYIAQQASATATLDSSLTAASAAEDFMAFFSSRGPTIRDMAIKPELVAVGTDMYTAAQKYDPNGEVYDPSGYASVQGTSFAAPLVAGTVALVKQKNPRMTPGQLKSAVVNTANVKVKDLDADREISAEVIDSGAGKLDAAAAVQTNVTVEPSTLSFGLIGSSLPASGASLNFCNFGTSAVTLRLSVAAIGSGSGRAVVTPSTGTVIVNAGACNISTTVRLTGSVPDPGVYEGDIQISGGSVPIHVPYAFFVGDGVPWSIFPLVGDNFEGEPGQEKDLLFKVVDKYAVPVSKASVRFQTTLGDGSIKEILQTTDELGIGFARVVLGKQIGEQEFFAAVGTNPNFGIYFSGRVRPTPALTSTGVVDAASQQGGKGFAPGSYISLYGRGLSDSTRVFSTPYLPLALAGVSVSFDVPSQKKNYPGRLHFVTDTQVNVQIPWELQGAPSAQVKVSISDSSSSVVSIPIASQSPSLFEYTDASGRMYAAAVGDGGVLGFANPAKKSAIISLYANGLGPVDNQPESGEPGPSNPLATVKNLPVITIGDRPAEVFFAGLAPGYVGLYQINVRIPADAPSGTQPIVVTSNGVASKAANLQIQ